MEVSNETPEMEQFENIQEETPPQEEVAQEEVIAPEQEAETEEVPQVEETQTNYYTPEEMRTLQVDGIDTSRIPPEMQPLYQAMQSPITRKSQELSEKLKNLEQGHEAPLQEQQPTQQPSIEEVATNVTLQKLGLSEKPEPWDAGYENYIIELADNRRDLKESVNKQNQAMSELNTFKSGFTPEQFKDIDAQAETKMYQMLADPSTRQEGQRIQNAIQTGDTKTVLSFVKEVAKEVLTAPTQPTQRTTPPVTSTPSGQTRVATKNLSEISNEEYRAYRMGS